MRPHHRQFVIGPLPHRPYEDWCTRRLDDQTWVSHCPDLRVGWAHDADGAAWALLGLAVETREERAMPLDEISRAPTARVPDLCASWAGRWVLVGGHRLHVDASGLLGCHYGTSQEQAWASSSPALLADILFGDGPPRIDSRRLRYEHGIAWIVPPSTRFAGMSRLLPSQVLDLRSAGVAWRPLLAPLRPEERASARERIAGAFRIALRRLSEIDSRLWLGLSAGYDSRTILALCRHADVDVKTFTRITARMSVADRLLPPELARACGYEHVFLRGRRGNPDRARLVAQHSAGHVSDGDARPFLDGDRDDLEGIAFGGHAFEIFTGDFDQLEAVPDLEATPEMARRIADAFGEPGDSTAAGDLLQWLRWTAAHPEPALDWRDRFFLEQDNAGWLSSKEQLYDMNRVERFPIVNAARNYALLLSIPTEECYDSALQVDLMRRACPELLAYPINPPDMYFGLRGLVAAKSIGLPRYLYDNARKKLGRRATTVLRRMSQRAPADTVGGSGK